MTTSMCAPLRMLFVVPNTAILFLANTQLPPGGAVAIRAEVLSYWQDVLHYLIHGNSSLNVAPDRLFKASFPNFCSID